MKFIQLILGINSSIAMYECSWCKVNKEDRGNVALPWDFYLSEKFFRSISEIKNLARSSSKTYGVKAAPLLNVEPHHYIPDELHLLMRIIYVLLPNLIFDASSNDNYGKIIGNNTDNVNLLVKAVQSCGVPFTIWLSKSDEKEWTSLTGTSLQKLLYGLPQKLLFCLHEDTADDVIKLWDDFKYIYETISDKKRTDFCAESVFEKTQSFVIGFLTIGRKKREGYQPSNVTPYLHTLVYRVPYFLQHDGSLLKFSGQGVEKTNDVIKHIYHGKTNKTDPTSDALIVRKRMELGFQNELSRVNGNYDKVDDNYLRSRIVENRRSNAQRILEEQNIATEAYNKLDASENFDELSICEIKKI